MADDFIRREDAREKLCSMCRWEGTENCGECENPIDDIPAADVALVRHGRWKLTGRIVGTAECACSRCGYISYGNAMKPDGSIEMKNFCPNCGADLREVQDG